MVGDRLKKPTYDLFNFNRSDDAATGVIRCINTEPKQTNDIFQTKTPLYVIYLYVFVMGTRKCYCEKFNIYCHLAPLLSEYKQPIYSPAPMDGIGSAVFQSFWQSRINGLDRIAVVVCAVCLKPHHRRISICTKLYEFRFLSSSSNSSLFN